MSVEPSRLSLFLVISAGFLDNADSDGFCPDFLSSIINFVDFNDLSSFFKGKVSPTGKLVSTTFGDSSLVSSLEAKYIKLYILRVPYT